jgi:hypothetical protein
LPLDILGAQLLAMSQVGLAIQVILVLEEGRQGQARGMVELVVAEHGSLPATESQ